MSSDQTAVGAIFRALVRHDGKMVAGLAVIPGGGARFFLLARRESDEAFIGRVSTWIQQRGAEGIRMERPDVLPQGTSVPEFLLRLRASIAAPGSDPEALEFDVKNPEHVIPTDAAS